MTGGSLLVRRPRRSAPGDGRIASAGLVGVIALVMAFAVLLDAVNLDVWLAMVTFVTLIAISVPLLRRIARRDGDPKLFGLLFAGMMLKLVFSFVRYFFVEIVYKGEADAGIYSQAGVWFSEHLISGTHIHPIPILRGFPPESRRIGDITGLIYTVTGPSTYAGYLVYSWFAFLGCLLMIRALKVAVPEADHRRYAILVLFLPSLLFWPSSIGKEAVMVFCLGLISYGAALLLAPRPRLWGGAVFAAGLGVVLLVRPHVALMSFGSLVVAVAVGLLGASRGSGGSARGRAIRLVALIALLLAAGVVTTRVSETFRTEDDTELSQSQALEKTLAQTSTGGSEFIPVTATSPIQLPGALVSVLFRPFPWEASSFNSLLAAGESALLVLLVGFSWRRVASFPSLARKRPYLVFVTGYILAFSVGFSYIGNFGILTRQRTQMLPMVLVLVSMPALARRRDRAAAERPVLGREPRGRTTLIGERPDPDRASLPTDGGPGSSGTVSSSPAGAGRAETVGTST